MQQNQDSSILSNPKEGKGKETGETCKEVENQQLICLYKRVYVWFSVVVSLSLCAFLYPSSYVHLYTTAYYYNTDVKNEIPM